MNTEKLNIRSMCAIFFVAAGSMLAYPAFASDSSVQSNSSGPVPAEVTELQRTAQSGSSEAQYKMGEIFEYGRGVQQNDAKAIQWYEKSATQGFANAQYRLAILYDNGWGSEVNKEKAFKLYKAAAENGVELAQHDVAIAYYQGSGTDKSHLHAYKWLRIADLIGSTLMQKHMHLVGAEMSPEDIETANRLAEEWVEAYRK